MIHAQRQEKQYWVMYVCETAFLYRLTFRSVDQTTWPTINVLYFFHCFMPCCAISVNFMSCVSTCHICEPAKLMTL